MPKKSKRPRRRRYQVIATRVTYYEVLATCEEQALQLFSDLDEVDQQTIEILARPLEDR